MFLSQTIREIKANWEKKTPKQKWNRLYEFAKKSSELIQIRFLTDYSVGIVGYCPAIALVLHCALFMYTMYFNINRGLYQECLPCFCVFGVATCVSKENSAGKLLNRIRFEIFFLSFFLIDSH